MSNTPLEQNGIDLDSVLAKVNALPQAGITPTGSITLTEEKSYDVTEKATAVVDFSTTRANLAEAVTAKGVDTLPTSSFDTIATNIGLISGGGSLPSSISKIDGGSFMPSSDTNCDKYYIQHNLGVVPKGFIIWNEDVEQYTAGTYRTIKCALSIKRTMLNQSDTITSLATDYFSMWNADGAPYHNQIFNYTTQVQVDREYTDSAIRFYYDSASYGAGMTYKWLAWA